VQLHIGESRDSGFDASHHPGMTIPYVFPILPSVPACNRLMFVAVHVEQQRSVSTANNEASARVAEPQQEDRCHHARDQRRQRRVARDDGRS